MALKLQPSWIKKIKEALKNNPQLQKFESEVKVGQRTKTSIHTGIVYIKEKYNKKCFGSTQFSLFSTSRRNENVSRPKAAFP